MTSPRAGRGVANVPAWRGLGTTVARHLAASVAAHARLARQAPGRMDALCDVCFHAPSSDTQRVQELHLVAWHAMCDAIGRTTERRPRGTHGPR
jgi:hypothetical protein